MLSMPFLHRLTDLESSTSVSCAIPEASISMAWNLQNCFFYIFPPIFWYDFIFHFIFEVYFSFCNL